jgi:hypothetical protein
MMTRSSAILALIGAGVIGVLGAASAQAEPSLFMSPAAAGQVILRVAPAADKHGGPMAPAVLGLGQPQIGLRPEVLAYTGVSTEGAVRLRLADAFYRQGLVIAPGPGGAAQTAATPGLLDRVALRLMSGSSVQTCGFACIGGGSRGDFFELAPRPQL